MEMLVKRYTRPFFIEVIETAKIFQSDKILAYILMINENFC